MRTTVAIACFAVAFGWMPDAQSATKSFIREYTYNASEADSKLSARAIALNQVKDLLFEELGSYIHSTFTLESKDWGTDFSEISTSQIGTISAGIAQTRIMDELWNGETYFLRAQITVDENDIREKLKVAIADHNRLNEMSTLRREADSAFAEIERLRKELLLAHSEREKLALQKRYAEFAATYTAAPWNTRNWHDDFQPQATPQGKVPQPRPKMQVVFALDATGSMGGMIANAKDKIWAIATNLAQTDPAPELQIGIIHYRDVRDQYVTQQLSLSTDLDNLYLYLSGISAAGGGDGPESVNQALYEAINNYQWDNDQSTYRTVFLIGDAPPHMDYGNDVKYQKSCNEAVKRDIVVNTIQCGTNPEAARVWKEIAAFTGGDYLTLDQQGSGLAVTTPYDQKLADKARELDNSRVFYGSQDQKMQGEEAQRKAAEIHARGTVQENARRVVFNNTSAAGKDNFTNGNELITAVMDGSVNLDEMAEEELPETLQNMERDERAVFIEQEIAHRKKLEEEVQKLNEEREKFIEKQLKVEGKEKTENSFNNQLFRSTSNQYKKKGIATTRSCPAF